MINASGPTTDNNSNNTGATPSMTPTPPVNFPTHNPASQHSQFMNGVSTPQPSNPNQAVPPAAPKFPDPTATLLKTTETTMSSSDSGDGAKPKSKMSMKTIIGVVILVIVLLGSGAGFYLTQYTKQDTRQQAAFPCSSYDNDPTACENVSGCNFTRVPSSCPSSISTCPSVPGCTVTQGTPGECVGSQNCTNQTTQTACDNAPGGCEWIPGTPARCTGTPTTGVCTGTPTGTPPPATQPPATPPQGTAQPTSPPSSPTAAMCPDGSGPAVWCATFDCSVTGDVNRDGQCTSADGVQAQIREGGNCPTPTKRCGQIDYYRAGPSGQNWDAFCGAPFHHMDECPTGGGTPTPTTQQPAGTYSAACSPAAPNQTVGNLTYELKVSNTAPKNIGAVVYFLRFTGANKVKELTDDFLGIPTWSVGNNTPCSQMETCGYWIKQVNDPNPNANDPSISFIWDNATLIDNKGGGVGHKPTINELATKVQQLIDAGKLPANYKVPVAAEYRLPDGTRYNFNGADVQMLNITPTACSGTAVPDVACTGMTGVLKTGPITSLTTPLSYTVTSSGSVSKVELVAHGNFTPPAMGTAWATIATDATPGDGSFTGTTTYGQMVDALVATGHDRQKLMTSGIVYFANVYGPKGFCTGANVWSNGGGACTRNSQCNGTALLSSVATATPTATPPVVYQCNSTCTSDAQCTGALGSGYSCYKASTSLLADSSAGNCRLTANPTSTSCTAAPVVCNSVCTPANANKDSLLPSDDICTKQNPLWSCDPTSSRCRLTANPTSVSCDAAPLVCNSSCDPNAKKDLCTAANDKWYCDPTAKACRFKTNPTSTSCQPPVGAVACNQACTTNAQCTSTNANYTCDSTSKTCRLSSNPTSTTCEPVPPKCNEACTTNAQCEKGDTDHFCDSTTNTCRLKTNPSSTTCVKPQATPTPTPAIGCNDTCVTNADCSNSNHICVTTADGRNKCRLESYTTSESCTLPTTSTAQPTLPPQLPATGPADWMNWLKAGLVTLGLGAALFFLL